jgi:hypothetical protein
LRIEIAGLVPGDDHDRLVVTGAATLNGTLAVELVNFTPSVGQTFEGMTFASRTGDFSALDLPCGAGFALQAQVNATNVVIEVIPGGSVPGDLNCDCAVDAGDVVPFALAVLDETAYDDAFPGCDRDNADLNDDLAVNAADVRHFLALILP